MEVEKHWLSGVRRLEYPGGPAMNIRRCAVVHFTAGASALSSVNYWRTPAARGAEAHVVIDRTGIIYQVRAFNQQADHAGRSRWRDPNTGKLYHGLNRNSIGIELANGGNSDSLIRRFSHLLPVRKRHQNGGPVENWEAFPPAQITALDEVLLAIVTRYNLDDVTGHDYIAPERKNDPGPAFPMRQVRERCGFKGLPVVHRK